MADERLLHEGLLAVARAARTLELEPFLQTVVAVASELTASEVAAVLEFDERTQSLRFLAVSPAYEAVRRRSPIPLGESAAARVIKNREPLQIPDNQTDLDALAGADLNFTSKTQSLLAVPLILTGKVLGVLEAINKNKSHYTEEDVTILEMLAAAAAQGMERDNLQRRLDASLVELADLDRLKSDFIAITSHELRTPLGVILGHATYLHEVLDPQYAEQINVIIKNASRLKEIVESVASMDNYHAGRSRARQEAVSMARIVAEVAASFAGMAAEQHVKLEAPAPAEDVLVDADLTKISIALGNLVKNAITFTNEGGRVLIQTEALPGSVKVSVIDNGIGIPRKDLPRVFDRFFQVEGHLTRRHNGMGLGLSVAKVMIEMHGGRIWVESVEGKGSTFSFLLPVHAVETQPVMF